MSTLFVGDILKKERIVLGKEQIFKAIPFFNQEPVDHSGVD